MTPEDRRECESIAELEVRRFCQELCQELTQVAVKTAVEAVKAHNESSHAHDGIGAKLLNLRWQTITIAVLIGAGSGASAERVFSLLFSR